MHISVRGVKKQIYLSFRYKKQLHRLPTQYQCEGKGDKDCKCKYHKLAFALSKEIERKIKEGNFDISSYFPNSNPKNITSKNIITFKDYASRWLANHLLIIEKTTAESYVCTTKAIIKYFDDSSISDIKNYHIQDYINSLISNNKKASYIKSHLKIIKLIFKSALIDDIIKENPIKEIKLPRQKQSKIEVLNISDINRILDYINTNYPKYILFFAISFYTGMRTGEVLALKWTDIDITNHTIKVNKTITKNILKTSTKTNIDRTVDIIPLLDKYIFNIQTTDDYIFKTKKGTHYQSQYYFRIIWQETLKALEIPYVKIYATRHSFACMMIEAGENPKWIANMLGHSDLSMLLKTYGNWYNPSKNERAGSKFLNFYQNVTNENKE